jgi:hypothetical protein
VLAVMMLVTMHRFLSDGVARSNNRQSDCSDPFDRPRLESAVIGKVCKRHRNS